MADIELKLKINFCDMIDLLALPYVGVNTAKTIARFRDKNGNITPEALEYIPKLKVTKRFYDSVDFTPNPQYDYSALDEKVGCPSTPGEKTGDPQVDVIGRLTQAMSLRERTLEMNDLQGAHLVYKSPHPLGRRGTPFRDRPDRTRSESAEDTSTPLQNRFQGLSIDSNSEESNEEFYDSLRELPYSRRPGESRFRPSKLPKTLCYNGQTHWDTFKRKFLHYAQSCELSWKDCQDALCWCFTDKAGDYNALVIEMDPEADVATIFRKMEKRCGQRELAETAQARFQQAMQQTDELLEDWADRILTLAGKTFKHLPEKHMIQQAVVRFCQGCCDKVAGQSACNSRPRTMEQALKHIRWYQYVHQTMYGKPKGVREVQT